MPVVFDLIHHLNKGLDQRGIKLASCFMIKFQQSLSCRHRRLILSLPVGHVIKGVHNGLSIKSEGLQTYDLSHILPTPLSILFIRLRSAVFQQVNNIFHSLAPVIIPGQTIRSVVYNPTVIVCGEIFRQFIKSFSLGDSIESPYSHIFVHVFRARIIFTLKAVIQSFFRTTCFDLTILVFSSLGSLCYSCKGHKPNRKLRSFLLSLFLSSKAPP